MQQLINRSEIPPDYFTFVCPETGFRMQSLHKQELFSMIAAHYKSNNLILPVDWQAKVEDRICQGLPPGWCKFVDPNDTSIQVGCTTTKVKVIKGVESLVHLLWDVLLGKDIYVDQAEADSRAEICSKCQFNVPVDGCMGCSGMARFTALVAKVKGSRTSKWDTALQNCCKCGCRNEAIVHIKKDILITGQTDADMLQYPVWCWKRSSSVEEAKNNLSL